MKIRTKIFMGNAMLAVSLLGLLTYYMSASSSKIILNKTKEDVGYSVSQLSQNIDNMLQSYEQLVDSLYTSPELQNKLLTRYDSFAQAQDVYFNYFLPFADWVRTSKDILRFVIYTDNPTFQFAEVRYIDDDVKHSAWYRSTLQSQSNLVKTWTLVEDDALLRRGVFRLTQKVHNVTAGGNIYVTLDLEERLLHNLISKENENRRFIIALPDGRVLIDTHAQDPYRKLLISDYDFYKQIADRNDYSSTYTMQGEQYLLTSKVTKSRNSVKGLTIIQLTPIDEMMEKVKEMKRLAILLFLFAVLGSVILIYLLSMRLTKQLMTFAKRMRTFDMNNSQSYMKVKGNDEISQLCRQFNEMMDRIKHLIEEVYESEIDRKELELQKKQFELYALQAQINPHYLFNTLNAIFGNLLEKGDQENAEMVNLLAQSFRNVLKRAGQMISISEELDIVTTYLRIQAFRFGERLVYDIDIPRELYRQEIPRISLQTLVENTIVHVLEKEKVCTKISIYAIVSEENWFSVTVEDNGPGIPAERLQTILAGLNDKSGLTHEKHIGLRNIHQRLQNVYGSPYGLKVESEEGAGTKITILLPLRVDRTEGELAC